MAAEIPKISPKDKFKLKHFIKELEQYKGRHTELVTVYIPQGYDLNKITAHVAQEQGTASNIKSKQTRDNVISALEKMNQHLKLFTKTPVHGLAVFAGNIAEREGQQDYRAWSIEPPIPLNQRLYRCDKEFVLDPLREMTEDKGMYGLVVMDKREGDVAILKGKTIIPIVNSQSYIPGKFKAGGQSSVRFARNRELSAIDFYKKIADQMKDNFYGKEEIKGILVGGPGPTKYELVDGNYILEPLKKKILTIKDLSYTGDFGLRELVERCEDILSKEDIVREKKAMTKFFDMLAKKPGMASYGEKETWKMLEIGAVDTLLLSESLDDEAVERFEKKAEELGTNVEIISVETQEGVQLREMGKIVAILRYEAQL
ncbi:MAG: peptide chain release factor aRF-1 [Candidatus Woesearchaeota archaeon]